MGTKEGKGREKEGERYYSRQKEKTELNRSRPKPGGEVHKRTGGDKTEKFSHSMRQKNEPKRSVNLWK